jgi:ribosomal protein S27AE
VAETKKKMICPDCQAEMNHHSDKLVYASDPRQAAAIDPSLGGLIQEFHTCPKCGGAASRHA